MQDGPYSWAVAVASLWIYTVVYGLVRLSGVMLVASIPRYGVGREAASLPYTLVNFTKNVSGVLVGLLANRFGVRPVMMTAILMAAIGVAGCFFAESIFTVAVLWGVVFGTGASCVALLPALINYNFDKYRAIASGISKCGVCLGSFIMPLVADPLIQFYDLSGTFLILSGIVLNCLPAALFLKCPDFIAKGIKPVTEPECDVVYATERQPLLSKKTNPYRNVYNSLSVDSVFRQGQPEKSPGIRNSDYNDKKSLVNGRDSSGTCKDISSKFSGTLDSRKASADRVADFSGPAETNRSENRAHSLPVYCPENTDGQPETCSLLVKHNQGNNISYREPDEKASTPPQKTKNEKSGASGNESVHLVCDPLFVLSLFASPFATFISTSMFAIVVDFAQDLGVSAGLVKYTVTAISGGEIAGHLAIGLLAHDEWLLRHTTLLVVCGVAQAAIVLAVAWATAFPSLVAALFFFGVITSAFSVVVPLVLGDFIAREKQMVAIASNAMLAGPASLTVTPLIGYFRDEVGSYQYFFYLISVCSILCGLVWLAIYFVSKRRKKY